MAPHQQQRQHQRHDDELARFDAGVEREQRRDDGATAPAAARIWNVGTTDNATYLPGRIPVHKPPATTLWPMV